MLFEATLQTSLGLRPGLKACGVFEGSLDARRLALPLSEGGWGRRLYRVEALRLRLKRAIDQEEAKALGSVDELGLALGFGAGSVSRAKVQGGAGQLSGLAAWLDALPELVIEQVEHEVQVRKPVRLKNLASVVVRGQLGRHLHRQLCTCGRGKGHEASCPYQELFRTPRDCVEGAHGSHGPHPFWLAGLPMARQLQAGECFRAQLRYLGPARAYRPALEASFVEALGRLGRARSRASAVQVESVSRTCVLLYGKLPLPSEDRLLWQSLSPILVGEASEQAKGGRVDWLVRSAIRRLAALTRAYGGRSQQLRVDGTLQFARGGIDLELLRWKGRRSTGSKSYPLVGYVGRAVMDRSIEVQPVAQLLARVQWTGLGKHTAFGFGDSQLKGG